MNVLINSGRIASVRPSGLGRVSGSAQSFMIVSVPSGMPPCASTVPTALVHGFFWDQNMTVIWPLASDTQSHAFAVNAGGTVAATSYNLGDLQPHGFTWQNGTPTALGNITPRGLNDAGTIVGYLSRFDAQFGWMDRPAVVNGGTIVELPFDSVALHSLIGLLQSHGAILR